MTLTPDHRRRLLALARAAVEARVRGADEPPCPALPLPDASGVFVTLKAAGQLRGCLGTLECGAGLAFEVLRCAAQAASEDPRFPPVGDTELHALQIEISVLQPAQPIHPVRPDDIAIGRHGLVVEHGARRGLLLPQVASEWSWTPVEFLAHTCVKAGLPADAWQNGARVFRFEAEVFGD